MFKTCIYSEHITKMTIHVDLFEFRLIVHSKINLNFVSLHIICKIYIQRKLCFHHSQFNLFYN